MVSGSGDGVDEVEVIECAPSPYIKSRPKQIKQLAKDIKSGNSYETDTDCFVEDPIETVIIIALQYDAEISSAEFVHPAEASDSSHLSTLEQL